MLSFEIKYLIVKLNIYFEIKYLISKLNVLFLN